MPSSWHLVNVVFAETLVMSPRKNVFFIMQKRMYGRTQHQKKILFDFEDKITVSGNLEVNLQFVVMKLLIYVIKLTSLTNMILT